MTKGQEWLYLIYITINEITGNVCIMWRDLRNIILTQRRTRILSVPESNRNRLTRLITFQKSDYGNHQWALLFWKSNRMFTFMFLRSFCPKVSNSSSYTDGGQHIRSRLGFSILPKDTSTCTPGESNQQPSNNMSLALALSHSWPCWILLPTWPLLWISYWALNFT